MQVKERKPMWEIKEAANPNMLKLYIYGDVEGDYYDWWSGGIVESETSANKFKRVLEENPDVTEIEIYINSYGGSVFEGTAIYNQLKRHPAKKTVYIDGFACSIASVIAMAGDEVVMPKNTMMMIHNMWMGAVGNAAELRKAADDLDIINAAGRQAYLQKGKDKLNEDELIKMMDEETWLTAEDCLRLGLADRYAENEVSEEMAKAIMQKANLSLNARIKQHKEMSAFLKELSESGKSISEPKKEPDSEPKTKDEPANVMQKLKSILI